MGNQVIVSSSQAVSPAIGNEQIDFIHSLGRDALHTLEDTGSIRSSALFLAQIDFSPAVLRSRLGRSLAAKGLEGVIQFDQQLDAKLLLKAIWLVDTQRWTEVANALKLAAQGGFCQLPITLAVADLERHNSKQACSRRSAGRPPQPLAPPAPQPMHRRHGGQVGQHGSPVEIRTVLLTPFNGPFVALIDLGTFANTNAVAVSVSTTEPPVGDASDAFMDRRPATAPLIRGVLEQPIADVLIYQEEAPYQ
ncbi:unnamed protein product [Vitrella brassicaformis CCMP3155]|uniref:Uncharacterized protein n=1 Tax=Vitrella brassicaformis (strain CCMP3155) TaxID=1169540 RepID=A0A0G4GWE7_VITBC|nr:unnamed protein product [Vitrella brassicaformis CCMP3155]|eukprot:CEM35329.1 unnamed protein product [Vitrella brassicaformis CCMP3155]